MGDAARNAAQVFPLQERNANEIFLRLDLLRTHSGFIERLAIVRRVLVRVADDALQPPGLALGQLGGCDALLLLQPAKRAQRLEKQGSSREWESPGEDQRALAPRILSYASQ